MNASEAQTFLEQHVSPYSSQEDGASGFMLENRTGEELLVSVDTLVCGVHFPEDTPPDRIAFKSLAVNLSDIASMGGEPFAYTLGMTWPDGDANWLEAYAKGLDEISNQYPVQRMACIVEPGPLSITIQIYGYVPQGQSLLRSTARPGDQIFISGNPGEAAGALQLLLQHEKLRDEIPLPLIQRLDMPMPRMALGKALRGIANACIDVSDGLLADLGHILEQSHLGAVVELEKIPLSSSLLESFSRPEAQQLALSGGDDYELCFTVAPENTNMLMKRAEDLDIPCTCIGWIVEQAGLQLRDADGNDIHPGKTGYDHFANNG